MECGKGHSIMCRYRPPCPEPELTLDVTKHSDNNFLTILLQDQIGGLQVLHENRWIDVPPIPGALVIIIGDLLRNFFIRPRETSEDSFESNSGSENLGVPIIDLGQIDRDPTKRREGIERMRRASEMLGFFRVVNPGVSAAVMGKEEGLRRFHEDDEAKKVLHTRDMMRKVMYSSNFDPNTTSVVN
ncbi:1-aminocyclopropane-1-carboxylate oxidase homolog 5-like [Rhodamnia argentea]|uniref:1-aminocyclopropane-1-carboxylate oxidase homolog 5-like n=1 Tax=Rhodamnia argentea TaxID=178133 RepID=A0ABM3HA85_9MYRT|nr:1-aminocyclopropane-1-carboxylate oxidase homolog 5-like [Rhodamnia argentea]